jgi:hypothetical protein
LDGFYTGPVVHLRWSFFMLTLTQNLKKVKKIKPFYILHCAIKPSAPLLEEKKAGQFLFVATD